jgi:hypothetical protein
MARGKPKKRRNWKRVEVFGEFLIFGILFGTIEDLIAVRVVADTPITLKIVGLIIVLAIPFAIVGELVADRIDFVKLVQKMFRKK